MEKSLSEAENAKWKEVATLNGNLKTQRLAAQTEQEVNALNAVYHLNKEILSKEQLDKLYKIAVLCPQISGSSVFTARGLYEIINQNVVDWKAIEKCKNVVISPVETKVSKQNTEIHANVFPNPSHDVLSINIQNAKTFDGEAVLYNLQGQEVYRKAIRIANTFDISTLSNGVYVLHINQNGLSIQTEKLTIIK